MSLECLLVHFVLSSTKQAAFRYERFVVDCLREDAVHIHATKYCIYARIYVHIYAHIYGHVSGCRHAEAECNVDERVCTLMPDWKIELTKLGVVQVRVKQH